ncbi:MAG: hypothetical protein ACK5LT_07700 [Lachnospirales bacterium]
MHKRFNYKNITELKEELERLNLYLPFSNKNLLKNKINIMGMEANNLIGILPMEGADSLDDGSPSELTKRRYKRFAKSGASVIWFEAVAVVPEGRSSKFQLMLTEKNKNEFKNLVNDIKEDCYKENGFYPIIIMQANHSGRYAKPKGTPEPIMAYNHPIYEKEPIDKSRIATDDYLDRLVEKFGKASKISEEVGFDAIDIKSCHGYLFAELASAYERKGKYGGNFENRFRLLLNSIESAKANCKKQKVTVRLGVYDGFSYPYGYGINENGDMDLSESINLINILEKDFSLDFLNITFGNPYQNPHVTRPYDKGKYIPNEHPLEGIARIAKGTKIIKDNTNVKIQSSATTYLREFSMEYANGLIEEQYCDMVAFGRMAFAYENFPKDLLAGNLNKNKCCVTCSECGTLLRNGINTGCIIRDELYRNIYKEVRDTLK